MVDKSYDPETVEVLDVALDVAYARASERTSVGDSVRSLLATAIVEGAQQGIRDPQELAEFALRALPAFRKAS